MYDRIVQLGLVQMQALLVGIALVLAIELLPPPATASPAPSASCNNLTAVFPANLQGTEYELDPSRLYTRSARAAPWLTDNCPPSVLGRGRLQVLGADTHTDRAARQPHHERRGMWFCLLRLDKLHVVQLQISSRPDHRLLDWQSAPQTPSPVAQVLPPSAIDVPSRAIAATVPQTRRLCSNLQPRRPRAGRASCPR